jgi:hypothetical protein
MEIAPAQAHAVRVRGRWAPISRRTGSMTRPPTSARVVVMTEALVNRSAAAVTG